jgi:hypothetical protein
VRVLLILALEAFVIGLTALVSYVVGRRAGFFRGVCRGMHVAGRVLGQGHPIPSFDEDYRAQFRRPN